MPATLSFVSFILASPSIILAQPSEPPAARGPFLGRSQTTFPLGTLGVRVVGDSEPLGKFYLFCSASPSPLWPPPMIQFYRPLVRLVRRRKNSPQTRQRRSPCNNIMRTHTSGCGADKEQEERMQTDQGRGRLGKFAEEGNGRDNRGNLILSIPANRL